MTLDKSKLAAELRKFCAPEDPTFAGFPNTIAEARSKWSAAFLTYISDLVIVTATVSPSSGTASFSGVSSAFGGPLLFANKMSAADEADELANAWAAGLNAVTLTPGGNTYGSPTLQITAIVPFAAQASVLKPALVPLFTGPSAKEGERCDEIADAIDTATKSAATTTCTTTDSSSGVTATAPLAYG